MALDILPPELMLQIATDLDPYSTFDFAVTCKDLQKLFKSILAEHARLSSKYRVIDTALSPEGGNDDHLIWSRLKEILEDPRRGWYVRELNLPLTRPHHWDSENRGLRPDNMLAVPLEEDQALFIEAAHALEGLYPAYLGLRDGSRTNPNPEDLWTTFIGSLETRISSGWDDAIIAILIHHVPLLETIRITDYHTDSLEIMLHWITATYKDPMRRPQLPFQHLRYASVAHWDTENCCNPDWACLFLSIPSLQAFAAHAMGDGIAPLAAKIYAPEDAPPSSNVQDLFLSCCVLDQEALKIILRGIKDLKTLYYTDGGVSVSPSEEYQPKRTIHAAAASVGHCLEELVLNQSDYGNPSEENDDDLSCVSLRNFQKLKTLQCELHMLLPGDGGCNMGEPLESGFYEENDDTPGDFDVRSILPESLQELQLQGTFDDGEWTQFSEMFSVQNTATPNLTRMRVENKNGPEQTMGVLGNAPAPIEFHLRPLAKLIEGHGQQ